MRLSTWLPALALLPSATLAAEGPIYTYTPATHRIAAPPPPDPVLTWKYFEKGTTFHYNTTAPAKNNWIGLFYAFGGGPDNGTKVMEPLDWKYAPDKDGVLRFDTSKYATGSYKAFFMAKDSYESLAPPTEFSVTDVTKVRFFADKMTLRPARDDEYYTYDIAKMTSVTGDPQNIYWMIYCNGDNWIKSTREGVLYGTPTKNSKRETKMAIKVTTRKNLSYFMEIVVPVRRADEPMVKQLKVVSMNMWLGGTLINDYHAKQVDIITKLDADIVSLQETQGIHALRLAHALGWWAYETWDASIISRYPIVEALTSTTKTAAVRIALDGDKQQVVVWGAHLGYTYYGPYGFCFDGKDTEGVLQLEQDSGRTDQAKELTEALKPYIDNGDKVPVIVTGDFNAPSHLDYTADSAHLHCGAGEIKWPSSWYPVEAGMKDSFREVNPDPVQEPGYTWSPIYLNNSDYDNKPEPKDRIDFIYYAGAMKANTSVAFMYQNPPPKPEPQQKDNNWPTDHRAVVTTFDFNVKID
ncbi:hypothetical protein PWT90_01178 [Aphanocladium album]|nr:hypothetical protein PWT90_01178 [Aphanocladium album]